MNATDDKTLTGFDVNNLTGFEDAIFDGKEQWVAHPQYDDENNVESYVVVFMDVEYDPVTVTIDLDGNITMPDDNNHYMIMNAAMLRKLADIADEIVVMEDDDEEE